MIKRFLEWIGIKEKINIREHIPPFFKEGEIWWCHIGENIGMEINGKGDGFTRPIFILRKYDKYSFLGLPLSTKIKSGTWYADINFGGANQVIILAQGRVFDYRRLKEKIGQLEEKDMQNVSEKYVNLHKK